MTELEDYKTELEDYKFIWKESCKYNFLRKHNCEELYCSDKPLSMAAQMRWLNWAIQEAFLIQRHKKAIFLEIPLDWTPEQLQIITKHPRKWLPLHEMLEHLDHNSRFDFWAMVFENRDNIPQKELLLVWYDCLNDFRNLNHQRVAYSSTFSEYHDTERLDTKELATSVITNPLLIDDQIVSYRYSQVHKPGWRFLQYIHRRRFKKMKMPEALRQAIRDDDAPTFAIYLDMIRMRITFGLLLEVLEKKAVCIFKHLIKDRLVNNHAIPLPELCCYLTTQFHDDISVPMLTIMDEVYPGLLKDVKDTFGRNLLWYAVQNMKTGWFHPNCKLTPFLLEHRCDPQNKNQIGLTWQAVAEGLTQERMMQMMRRRYTLEQARSSKKLQRTQPLDKIKKRYSPF